MQHDMRDSCGGELGKSHRYLLHGAPGKYCNDIKTTIVEDEKELSDEDAGIGVTGIGLPKASIEKIVDEMENKEENNDDQAGVNLNDIALVGVGGARGESMGLSPRLSTRKIPIKRWWRRNH